MDDILITLTSELYEGITCSYTAQHIQSAEHVETMPNDMPVIIVTGVVQLDTLIREV